MKKMMMMMMTINLRLSVMEKVLCLLKVLWIYVQMSFFNFPTNQIGLGESFCIELKLRVS